MAKKIEKEIVESIPEKISVENLEDVMGDRYATYAKYVIQDRAIPDVRDGLKPVQRRIIFSMLKNGNTINKPTRKCAHTVGAVMGTYHPHGDTSIYEALARMSQDWKLRYPLIDFQGNNGSIDGDQPAAYRYTEARLAEISNELLKDIEKRTVDMQLNFDDTELEPIVLPSRFPNLLVNGTEGIAVALATEIPPHNLKEVIEAIIYRINHKTATVEDLMEFIPGPDFPGGGIIYRSEGLKNIYLTGKGRIEIAAKTEIVHHKDVTQIVISEIPYKVVKKDLVFEIDKIIHSKTVSGLIEIRDESDYHGIRIVIDCKKDAKVELLLKYLMNKTPLVCSYSANMVAIDNGRPKTLTLIDYIDSYIAHQVDVITRRSEFDLEKYKARLHIVDGLIIASININEVVEIIRKSNDKADSKVNLMARFNFSNEQAEAIVTMPLYKLSHTDEEILIKEKADLEKLIIELQAILEDPNKLNRVLIKDLKAISEKYGDDRRTLIEEKGEEEKIDKRELIAKEETIVVVTRDGYIKRSTIKSYKGSGENVQPGLKSGDALVGINQLFTTDYLICFTNIGNYFVLPVHKINENRWKDEGTHVNSFVSLGAGEKIMKCMGISCNRNDLYLGFLTKFGQIKRMCLSQIEFAKRSRPIKCMKLLNGDEVVGVEVLSGNSDLLVITNNGHATLFNENELSILGSKAGGVKSTAGLGKNNCVSLISLDPEEKAKIVLITNKGCQRILLSEKVNKTARLGKTTEIMPSFKSDVHSIVAAYKIPKGIEKYTCYLYLNDSNSLELVVDDFHMTDLDKYAKKNIEIPAKTEISSAYDASVSYIDKTNISYPVARKEEIVENNEVSGEAETSNEEESENNSNKSQDESFEQISIFDDME